MIASFNYQNKGAEKVDCPVCKISCYKRGKKTPQKVYGTFRLFPLCSIISWIERRQSSCPETRI
jgi:hypothetical protein